MRAALLALVLLAACSRTSGARPVGGKVPVTADGNGFSPSAIEVGKGEPLELVFTRTTEETCATSVDLPELGVKKELPLKTPVSVKVPTDTARRLTFQCGMGMYKSSVVVR